MDRFLTAIGAAVLTCAVACGKDECPAGTLMSPGLCMVPEAGHPASGGVGGSRQTGPWVVGGNGWPVIGGTGGSAVDSGLAMSVRPDDPKCGNGIVEPGEECDGASCPLTCDTGNACLKGSMVGQRADCTLHCIQTEITACNGGDGCCPPGCDHNSDSDCSGTCGDGKVQKPETCDGDCPTTCDDGDACTLDTMTGTAKKCSLMCGHSPVKASKTKDGCCPMGANPSVDPDCDAKCGDGVITGDETCDTASSKGCPSSCDDLDPCTTDTRTGSAATCSAVCSHGAITDSVDGDGCCLPGKTEADDSDCKIECYKTADCPNNPNECLQVSCSANKCVTKALTRTCVSGTGQCQPDGSCKPMPKCGDGKIDPGELCDGNCKTCDDGNPCTDDKSSGSANTCDLSCTHTKIAAGGDCGNGMRCDSSGACKAPTCGDGVVDQGEVCDGNCPTSCPDVSADQECKSNVLVKGANACDVQCMPGVKTAGWVCNNTQGSCYLGMCYNNVWYQSCSTKGGGCGNSLKCRTPLDYCTNQCISDSQCGKAGTTQGKCFQGWCNRPCSTAADCYEGQACYEYDIGKVCRPKTCGQSNSADPNCPVGMRCALDEAGQFNQCVP